MGLLEYKRKRKSDKETDRSTDRRTDRLCVCEYQCNNITPRSMKSTPPINGNIEYLIWFDFYLMILTLRYVCVCLCDATGNLRTIHCFGNSFSFQSILICLANYMTLFPTSETFFSSFFKYIFMSHSVTHVSRLNAFSYKSIL